MLFYFVWELVLANFKFLFFYVTYFRQCDIFYFIYIIFFLVFCVGFFLLCYLRPVSYVANISVLFILDCPSVFSNVYLKWLGGLRGSDYHICKADTKIDWMSRIWAFIKLSGRAEFEHLCYQHSPHYTNN
jgi:hypothetical protein